MAEPAVYLTVLRHSPLASSHSSRHKTRLSLPGWAGAAQSLPAASLRTGPPPALAVSITSLQHCLWNQPGLDCRRYLSLVLGQGPPNPLESGSEGAGGRMQGYRPGNVDLGMCQQWRPGDAGDTDPVGLLLSISPLPRLGKQLLGACCAESESSPVLPIGAEGTRYAMGFPLHRVARDGKIGGGPVPAGRAVQGRAQPWAPPGLYSNIGAHPPRHPRGQGAERRL